MIKTSVLFLILATPVAAFAPTPLRPVRSPTLASLVKPASTSAATRHSPLFLSSLAVQSTEQQEGDDPQKKLGPIAALRATMRAATGLSLTAMYAATIGFTSGFVRDIMKRVLRVFPTWVSGIE